MIRWGPIGTGGRLATIATTVWVVLALICADENMRAAVVRARLEQGQLPTLDMALDMALDMVIQGLAMNNTQVQVSKSRPGSQIIISHPYSHHQPPYYSHHQPSLININHLN